jgi:hypothetical protein
VKKVVPFLLCLIIVSSFLLSGCEPEVRYLVQTVTQTVTTTLPAVTITQNVGGANQTVTVTTTFTNIAAQTTNTPTTTSEVGLSRSNPVPRGSSLVTPDGIEITITNVITGDDAWEILDDASWLNDEPDTGYQYVIVTVKVRNVSGDEPYSINYYDFSLIGNSNVEYNYNDNYAWLPDSGDLTELDTSLYIGGQCTGSIAFYLPEDETNVIMISDLGYIYGQDLRRYFAVY